jgi:glyoxylase-like metal-dependent hydrolase (beta-lactamase superfamily II)
MQSIAKNVYIENQYAGVTLGVISHPQGLIEIDAPPSPENGRAWRATLLELGSGPERLLINLDAHPDRTLGVRSMECPVVAHERTAHAFRNRPTTFKAGAEETGAEWELIGGLTNIRWTPPEISFTHTFKIRWDNLLVILEHHAGPSGGACWVILPEEKVIFIGDAILRNQPPFLAHADIPLWLEGLNLLLTPAYRDYRIVSGRGGLIPPETIRSQRNYLKLVQDKLQKLAAKNPPSESIENLVAPLLGEFKVPTSRHRQYAQRLRYGLARYYTRHYRTTGAIAEEE